MSHSQKWPFSRILYKACNHGGLHVKNSSIADFHNLDRKFS